MASNEVQCNTCKVWYGSKTLNGQSVIKSGKHECLNCIELEALSSPMNYSGRNRAFPLDEDEHMYLPGGIFDDRG